MFLAIVMFFLFTSCNADNKDETIIKNGIETEEVSEPTETTNSENNSDSEDYSDKVYYVGDDITAGGYVIKCTGTDYAMDAIVFSSEEDYESFQNSDRFTNGEFSRAVELNAWADFSLEKDEEAYIRLNDGYIIFLDNGQCEFNKYDPSISKILYSGIYVIGDDISADKVNMICTSDSLRLTLFFDKDQYLKYHKVDRYTRGEESEAIKKFADSTDFIYTDDSIYADLQEGMIVMVEDGVG